MYRLFYLNAHLQANLNFFRYSCYGWGTKSENMSKSVFVEGVGHFEAKYIRLKCHVYHQHLYTVR